MSVEVNDDVTAAGFWQRLGKKHPQKGRSYLIWGDYNGIQTADVAFYNGVLADGSHWWTMGNIDINRRSIVYYAELNPPAEEVNP